MSDVGQVTGTLKELVYDIVYIVQPQRRNAWWHLRARPYNDIYVKSVGNGQLAVQIAKRTYMPMHVISHHEYIQSRGDTSANSAFTLRNDALAVQIQLNFISEEFPDNEEQKKNAIDACLSFMMDQLDIYKQAVAAAAQDFHITLRLRD